jgi:general secretion pathway protein F
VPLYAYKGLSSDGKSVTGTHDADSPKTLRAILRKDGVVVTDCAVSKGGKKTTGTGTGLNKEVSFGELFGGVKKVEVASFTRQVATLLKAGIPLAETLGAVFDQTENVRFKAMLGQIKTEVNEGSSLADALAKHPKAFDDLFVSMTRAGEVSGNLDQVLGRLADFMESGQELRNKVQGAMIYPIIMFLVGAGIMVILMVAVIPNITEIFEQKDQALPWNTQFLIWTSHMVGTYWFLWIPAVIGGIYLFIQWTRSENGKPQWHQFLLKMPLLGPLVRQVAVSRFARTLGTMLASGVPMLRAIEVSKATLGNVILMRVVEDAKTAIAEGESIAVTLKKSGQFPPMMTHMIAVGERAGQLENMLFRVADTFDREVEHKLGRLTSTLEPMMLVGMGVAVAFVVFSILMPIMDMSQFSDMG